MREHEFKSVLAKITYKPNHELRSRLVGTGISEVWWTYDRPDRETFEPGTGDSGSVLIWWGNPNANAESIVRTVFGMTKRKEEHETREFLRYEDQRPFDPHVSLVQ